MCDMTWFLFPEDYDDDDDADDEGGGDVFGDSTPPTIPIVMTPDDEGKSISVTVI